MGFNSTCLPELRAPCGTHAWLLTRALEDFLSRSRCDCIALSGGIDTSLIVALAGKLGRKLRAYTAFYLGGIPRDLPYVNYLEKLLGLNVKYVAIDNGFIKEHLQAIKECVGVGDDYVELRNDLVYYAVLKEALMDRCRCVYVGSGGDEVFAGYRFMIVESEDRIRELRFRYALGGRYPELIIGKCLGVEVVAPYLSKEVLEVALRVPITCLKGHALEGKAVLRNVLSELNLSVVGGRPKTPAEAGAGTDVLSRL